MDAPRPAVGRTVHYASHGTPPREDGSQAYPSACRAAVITQVAGDAVGLAVLTPSGLFFHEHVAFGDGHPHTEVLEMCTSLYHEPGTWHWPARV